MNGSGEAGELLRHRLDRDYNLAQFMFVGGYLVVFIGLIGPWATELLVSVRGIEKPCGWVCLAGLAIAGFGWNVLYNALAGSRTRIRAGIRVIGFGGMVTAFACIAGVVSVVTHPGSWLPGYTSAGIGWGVWVSLVGAVLVIGTSGYLNDRVERLQRTGEGLTQPDQTTKEKEP